MRFERFTEAVDKRFLDPLLALWNWFRESMPKPVFEAVIALIVGYVVARLMLRQVYFGVGLVTGIVCLLLLLRRPYWVIYGALALVPLHWMRLLGNRVRIVSFLALVGFLYYLFSSMIERRKLNERVFWLYLAFVGVCLMSMANSTYWAAGYHYMRMYFFALMFGFAFVMAVDDEAKLRNSIRIVLVWGILSAILGLLQSLVSIKFFPAYHFRVFGLGIVKAYTVEGIYRASGTLESGPRYAMFILLPMALALCYFFLEKTRQRQLWLGAMILLGLAILVSFTRAAYAMVFLLFVGYFATERRRTLAYKAIFYTVAVGVLFAFIVAVAVPTDVNEAVGARLRFETSGTYKDRIYFGYNGFRAFLENPLLGIGPGVYNARSWEFMQRFVVPWESLRWEVSSLEMPQGVAVHNAFIRIMAETGFMGILLYIGIFWVTFSDLLKVIRDPANEWMHATARGLMLYMAIMMIYWFFHEYIFDEAYIAILPIAFSAALRRINDRMTEDRPATLTEQEPR